MTKDEFDAKFAAATSKAFLDSLDPKMLNKSKEEFITANSSLAGKFDTELEIAFMSKIMKSYTDKVIYSLLKDLLVD